PLGREHSCNRLADPLAAPGHDGVLVPEPEIHCILPPRSVMNLAVEAATVASYHNFAAAAKGRAGPLRDAAARDGAPRPDCTPAEIGYDGSRFSHPETPMQTVVEKPATGTIRARFNYVLDAGVPLVRYIDWPEMEHLAVPPQYREYEMAVHDGRPLRHTFQLDTHGFVFVDHVTQVKDFTDEAERTRVYDAEVQALIKKHSGASHVHVFDHTIR